jgi:hypothetical protein
MTVPFTQMGTIEDQICGRNATCSRKDVHISYMIVDLTARFG